MRVKILPVVPVFAFLLWSGPLQALVDLKSAGYTGSWVDFRAVGTGPLADLLRVYKSRTLFDGIFGFGWCTPYETSLRTMVDGKIQVTVCGSGQETVFRPAGGAAVKSSAKPTEYRAGADTLRREADAYTLRHVDGSTEKFNRDGQLTGLADAAGSAVRLRYTDGRLAEIEDSRGNRHMLSYRDDGKVKEIRSPGGLRLRYDYRGGNLMRAQAVRGERPEQDWEYEYDAFHNLTRVVAHHQPSKNEIRIQYDTGRDWVKTYTDEEGCTESFRFKNESNGPTLKQSAVTEKLCGEKKTGSGRYELWYSRVASAEPALTRIVKNLNGETEELKFDAQGRRLSQKTGDLRVSFSYDKKGRLQKRESSYLRVELTYHGDGEAIASSRVTHFNGRGKRTGELLTRATYDSRGRLRQVTNSANRKVVLAYDEQSRITKLTDEKNRSYTVTHDEIRNRPSRIVASGLGELKVSFTAEDGVRSVSSDRGADGASRISAGYLELLEMMAPIEKETYQ